MGPAASAALIEREALRLKPQDMNVSEPTMPSLPNGKLGRLWPSLLAKIPRVKVAS
jgi:hypothetical protein